jgi:beta-galactosidase
MGKWFDQSLRTLTNCAADFKFERLADSFRLTASVLTRGARPERCADFGGNHTRAEPTGRPLDDTALQFRSQLEWTVYPDGSIACQAAIVPVGPAIVLPKLGVAMELPDRLGNVTYFGRGPEENYPDRKSGSFLGQYNRTVSEMFVPYARPNDMANREEVRWIALTDKQGDGALFTTLGEPMSAAALPYSASELLLANHPPELPKSTRTVLTLDTAVLGLGGASCGPGPMERDIPKANRAYHLGFLIRPVGKSTDLAAAARVSAPTVAPVAIMQQKSKLALSTATAGAVIFFQTNGGPEQTFTAPITAKAGDKVLAWAGKEGLRSCVPTALEVAAAGPDKSGYSIKYVNSQQTGEGEAAHLIDNDPDTYWHTEYALTVTKHPHTVDIDLGEPKSFKAIGYLPRQGGPNGRVAQYRFAVSDDAQTWTTVAEGRFPRGEARQVVPLKAPVKARYLRFVALSELQGQDFAAAGEIDIIPAN